MPLFMIFKLLLVWIVALSTSITLADVSFPSWPNDAQINQELTRKIGLAVYSPDLANSADPLQRLIDQAYKDIFSTKLGVDICTYVFLAGKIVQNGKINYQTPAEYLYRILGISANASYDIVKSCVLNKVNDEILSPEVTYSEPEDIITKNDDRIQTRPKRNYLFIVDNDNKLPVDSFTDWDSINPDFNYTYLIFNKFDQNFYIKLVVRLAHEMAVTLDTKRNLNGIRRQGNFANQDLTYLNFITINNFTDENHVRASLSEPQIQSALTAMRATIVEEKIVTDLIRKNILPNSANNLLNHFLEGGQRNDYSPKLDQREFFLDPKHYTEIHFKPLLKNGQICVKNLKSFIQILSPIKFKVMNWEKKYFSENPPFGYALEIKKILYQSEENLQRFLNPDRLVIDLRDSSMIRFSRPGPRENLVLTNLIKLIERNNSNLFDLMGLDSVNPNLDEYEKKVIPYFLNFLSNTVIAISLPGDSISKGQSFNNLCTFMSMPKLSGTNIPLSGGPRPSSGPGG